jgi:hypothetical protein
LTHELAHRWQHVVHGEYWQPYLHDVHDHDWMWKMQYLDTFMVYLGER